MSRDVAMALNVLELARLAEFIVEVLNAVKRTFIFI